MARPSLYDPKRDYGKLANDYLEMCGREQTKLPILTEFCREYIGVNEDTVNKWLKDKKKKKLIGAVKKVRSAQKEQLMNDGMYGGKEVNSTMAIFLLKVNHGMVETEKRILEGSGVNITLDIKKDDE